MCIKVVLVDDEPAAIQNLKILLADQQDMEVQAACHNGKEAIKTILANRPDLVLLDIQMPEVSGFDVIKAVQPFYNPVYIFTTAYNKYAVDAFEINALDYLLKPFDDQRFFTALGKARQQIQSRETSYLKEQLNNLVDQMTDTKSTTYLQRISIKSTKLIYFIEVAEIMYLKSENQYVNIFLKNGTQHLNRCTLNYLEDTLDPQIFFRCHRSTIINIQEIRYIEPYFNGDYSISLKNGTKIKLSKTRKEGLRALMNW